VGTARRASPRWPSLASMEIYELQGQLRERLDALGPAARAELLHIFASPTRPGR
jgi:hypothetical protein